MHPRGPFRQPTIGVFRSASAKKAATAHPSESHCTRYVQATSLSDIMITALLQFTISYRSYSNASFPPWSIDALLPLES